MAAALGQSAPTRSTSPTTTRSGALPERDPRALWEKLVLDGFQAGLAWITILTQARGVPRRLRRLRSRGGGAVRRGRSGAAAGRRRHRPLAAQDRRGDRRRPHLSRHARGGRGFRRLAVVVRRRRADRQPLDATSSRFRPRRRGAGDGQGAEGPRLQVLRAGDLLRLHAGDRHGQRSPRRLLPPRRGRAA